MLAKPCRIAPETARTSHSELSPDPPADTSADPQVQTVTQLNSHSTLSPNPLAHFTEIVNPSDLLTADTTRHLCWWKMCMCQL